MSSSAAKTSLPELFSLSWSDFASNAAQTFTSLREDDAFLDVRLASADGSVHAHKLVLASCSPVLKTIFIDNDNSNSRHTVFLRNASLHQLQLLLDFVYKGTVAVAQEELKSFLALAEDLQIQGLSQSMYEPSNSMSDEGNDESADGFQQFPNQNRNRRGYKRRKKLTTKSFKRQSPILTTDDNNDNDEGMSEIQENDVKVETNEGHDVDVVLDEDQDDLDNNNDDGMDNFNSKQEEERLEREDRKDVDDQVMAHLDRGDDGRWRCIVCSISFRDKTDARRHAEGKHVKAKYKCPVCGRFQLTWAYHLKHVRKNHPECSDYDGTPASIIQNETGNASQAPLQSDPSVID